MKSLNSIFALLHQHKKSILLIIIVSTATILISSLVSIWLSNIHNLTLPTMGTIKTIGVEAYWDPNLENKTETIDWNTIWPGETKNLTLYIRSVSNVKTTLDIYHSDISPVSLSEYLSLYSNYDGKPLNPGGVIQLTLFLKVSDDESFILYTIANDVTDFSIDIYIVAYE